MPTEIQLTGVTCRLDLDQDPEAIVCVWRANIVDDGTPITLEASSSLISSPSDALDAVMESEDYEF